MLFKFASCSRSFVVLRIVVLRELFAFFVRLFDDRSFNRPSCALLSHHPARSFALIVVLRRERVVVRVRSIVRAHHHNPPAARVRSHCSLLFFASCC